MLERNKYLHYFIKNHKELVELAAAYQGELNLEPFRTIISELAFYALAESDSYEVERLSFLE
jgi:hypothetical protein